MFAFLRDAYVDVRELEQALLNRTQVNERVRASNAMEPNTMSPFPFYVLWRRRCNPAPPPYSR